MCQPMSLPLLSEEEIRADLERLGGAGSLSAEILLRWCLRQRDVPRTGVDWLPLRVVRACGESDH